MNIGERTGTATLLAIAVFPLLLGVAGCASFDGRGLKPGQATSADVERVMGKPVETRKVRGQTLLYYSREPNGGAIFVARIGPDDRLIDIEDRLTDANVAKIVPNVPTAGQLQNLLGPPWETGHYAVGNNTGLLSYNFAGSKFGWAMQRVNYRGEPPAMLDGVAMNAKLNLDDGLHPNSRGVTEITKKILPSVEQLIERARAKQAAGTKG